jgi:predicted acetyltransferase
VLLDLDLTQEVRPFVLPVDDAVVHLLEDVRACSPFVHDNLWVRLLDVPAALAGRRYAADVDVVLDVRDELVAANAGRWRVSGRAFAADVAVERTTDPADLTLDVRELGAAYLGGTTLLALAGAGLVVPHGPGTLAAASAAFSWPVAPCASWVF